MMRTYLAAFIVLTTVAMSACGHSTSTPARTSSNPLTQAADATIRAQSFTVTVNTSGNFTYQATMHYNAPDRVDLFTRKDGAPVESLSIGTTNYLSDGASPPHYFVGGPAPKPFSESFLDVLRTLKTAEVTGTDGSKVEITEHATPTATGAATIEHGFISELTLHFPTNTTEYKFSSFNSAPKIQVPAPSQIHMSSTFPTLPGVPPLQKCNSDGSIPAGATVCGE